MRVTYTTMNLGPPYDKAVVIAEMDHTDECYCLHRNKIDRSGENTSTVTTV